MKGRIFIALFGLPFFAVGIWAFFSITGTLIEWANMKTWEPVPARVLSGGYHSRSGSKGGSTYEAYGEYVYSYGGEKYKSTRIMIDSGSDNIGSFQKDLGRKLQRAASQRDTAEVYVNPKNPEEAVFNRDMRWGMVGFKSIFLICFGGVGGGLILAAIKFPKEKDLTRPEYQASPWLANDAWQTSEVRSNSKNSMYFAWGFTIFWNAISAALPFIIYEEVLEKHNYPALIGLLFPLIGIGLLVWAIRRTLVWKKFGHAPVVLDPFPGSIGGQAGGTIELAYPYDPAIKFILTLSNIYSYESGGGKNRSRHEKVHWQDKAVAHTEAGIYGTRITFRFDVPEGLTPSDAVRHGSSYYLWRLTLEADMPGVDIDTQYEIPVYPTGKKSSQISERVADASEQVTQEMESKDARAKILLRPGIQGDEMVYPIGRNIGPSLVGALVGAIFAGAGGFVSLHEKMHFFGGIFVLIGVPIVLSCLYMCVNSLTVRKDGRGDIETTRRILGLPVKTRRIRTDDVQALLKESSFATQSGNKQVKHYTVYTLGPDRKKIVLGEGFHGEGEADAAIALIREKLGISA